MNAFKTKNEIQGLLQHSNKTTDSTVNMKEYHLHNKLVVMVVVMVSLANALTTTTTTKHYYNSIPSSWRSTTARHASLITDDNVVNGNIAPSSSVHEGLTLSPYHVLHSNHFDTHASLSERKIPLHSCLRLLRQALTMIANGDETTIISQLQLSNENPLTMLRIEQTISHTVDPLCWLQAQTQTNDQPPSLYFATAEGTLETAAYGSSKTFQGTTMDDDYWELVQGLPPRSHLYGGQRFDTNVTTTTMGDEWSAFSKGFWMLPAIEIRCEKSNHKDTLTTTTVAVHLYRDNTTSGDGGFAQAATHVLELLQHVTDMTTTAKPPTTLPPVLSRASTYCANMNGMELYETGVSAALAEFENPDSTLEKVVLARRMDLSFSKYAKVAALDIMRKWKFGSKPGGHMFYVNPGGSSGEFFGCTPERLFQVQSRRVVSEALAGTRTRGSTQEADEELSRQLFESSKDQKEHTITAKFVREAFDDMKQQGWVENEQNGKESLGKDGYGGHFYVRRLRHLQHLCQRYDCNLSDRAFSMDAIKFLLNNLHPTPAVGGYPKNQAMEFIRKYETTGFDRGFYSGPVGFVSKDAAEIVVAIRSGLLSQATGRSKVSVFAGAGLVPGSTVQGEWAETSHKLAVVSSIFSQSPMTLQGAPTPNAAWATAFVEEFVRNGVTQFYICPGSRSTPLVAAVAKAVRANVGSVHALSVHDERGAGFRALGYGRGAGQPAAVITSSGTAIANLYPSIIEAGMDGVPLLVITADRPYESRDTGANQAIDQVKAFSSSYVRWFRDIAPPNDDVPIAVGLADAAHGINLARERRGPVHFNVQFRENLAPDGGPIRNDDRQGSVTSYDGVRFTDTPAFQRWSLGGGQWTKSLGASESVQKSNIVDIGRLIKESKRGMIVVGNLRKSTSRSQVDVSETVELLSNFAQTIGFPIFAGVQSGSLRFESPAVVPFAEHILRSPLIQENLRPDLVLQFGTPLVSTEILKVVKKTMVEDLVHHVLIHPHHPTERADPEFTVSHKVDSEILPFIKALSSYLEETPESSRSSQLTPLINLGRSLQPEILSIVNTAVAEVATSESGGRVMTEPEIILSLSEMISERKSKDISLFLSNSMPVRDAEAFLYPLVDIHVLSQNKPATVDTAVNRGASGIDGIIASAAGFADSTNRRTVLVIGDVSYKETRGKPNSCFAISNTVPSFEHRLRHCMTLILFIL
jgi:2-succinyl-5-enolpyruvyl-6-hydroxy-3-cyclohexene-1-carboxylate synthase